MDGTRSPPEVFAALYTAIESELLDGPAFDRLDLACLVDTGKVYYREPLTDRSGVLERTFEIDRGELAAFSRALDVIPIKLVLGRIVAACARETDACLLLQFSTEQKAAATVVWITAEQLQQLVGEALESGKSLPHIPYSAVAATLIEFRTDNEFLTMLGTIAINVNRMDPLRIWSSRRVTSTDADGTATTHIGNATPYDNFFTRRHFADFLFDFLQNRLPYIGGFIHEFNLYVYQELMTLSGGLSFSRICEHGLRSAITSESTDLTPELELRSDTRNCLNGIFRYPVF